MAVQGPVDGAEPIMVGYLDKFSMTGLVKVRRASSVLLATLRVCRPPRSVLCPYL